jgi:integrase/recombinase XerD
VNVDGTVKAEVRLTADQTKGRQPRTVFLPQKLRDELQGYVDLRQSSQSSTSFVHNRRQKGFLSQRDDSALLLVV